MKDTSPPIERRFRNMLMQRTGAERLKMGCSMHATVGGNLDDHRQPQGAKISIES